LTPIARIESQPLAAGKPIVATRVVGIQGRRRLADLAVSPAGDEALLALYRGLALSTGRRG
jgi:hypothetical protein